MTVPKEKKNDLIISHYDPHIIPAETAARVDREGDNFCKVAHDDPKDLKNLHTRDGYTIDRDGLINNYPVAPEMYIHHPGDLKKQELKIKAERLEQLQALSEDEEGKLTLEQDLRHQGPGLI